MPHAVRALAGALALAACASEPKPIPAHLDPSNPDAPEAPAITVSGALAVARYTCPMHPEVRSDQPGRCPKCGMALEPVKPAEPERTPDAGAPPAEHQHHHHGGGR